MGGGIFMAPDRVDSASAPPFFPVLSPVHPSTFHLRENTRHADPAPVSTNYFGKIVEP